MGRRTKRGPTRTEATLAVVRTALYGLGGLSVLGICLSLLLNGEGVGDVVASLSFAGLGVILLYLAWKPLAAGAAGDWSSFVEAGCDGGGGDGGGGDGC